ncbi:hypothetical protein DPM13_12660 [Paracoccus mutanolyticus]|uniref:Uncharacterized protein n=1 Tax=Paracoccus mutanolyticus TaxID=1499308 RepID=A0ABM6WT32_9RHOB|nr:SDR family oxidoreductase [Paracoccus mutanolyticus]AWX93640.1 hypothetical protein DPM13_12660 [Paracoccus mutanolyticus]
MRPSTLAAGIIDTEIQKDVFTDASLIVAMADAIPLKRVGTADEVADCALWLFPEV